MDLDGESDSEARKNGTGIAIPTSSGDAPEAASTAVRSKKRDAPPDMQEGTEKKKKKKNKKKKKKKKKKKNSPALWAGCREKLLSGSWAVTVNRDTSFCSCMPQVLLFPEIIC